MDVVMSPWFIPGVVAVVGMLTVLALTIRAFTRRPGASRNRRAKKQVHMACTICSQDLTISRDSLRALENIEMGMAIRSDPTLSGRKLAEYTCLNCGSAHCFATDEKEPVWVGVNLYQPETKGTRCLECHGAVRVPPWAPGVYDERLDEVPVLNDAYGMICPRCDSVLCAGCCKKTARNHPDKGLLVCPRCHRGPVDRFFTPQYMG